MPRAAMITTDQEKEFRRALQRLIPKVGGVRELARRIGVSSSTVSAFMTGARKPGPKLIASVMETWPDEVRTTITDVQPRTAANMGRVIEMADRYAVAQEVIERLVNEGVCPIEDARSLVGRCAFQEGPEGVSVDALFGLVLKAILFDRGMLTGARVETAATDDDL